jgi:ribonucleoside-diphosphate reductase alpha chain
MPAGLRKQGYSKVAVERIMDYVLGTSSLVDCPVISQGTLMDLGFTEAELSKLDDAIPKVLGIRGLFSPEIVGIDFCKEVLELDEAQMDAPTFDLLTHLRFSRAEVQLAEDHIFGRLTIEGAPGLKEEHLAVFDCAQPCGRIGKRSIPWKAHVDMMAAAQPFISGAISKTINMPADVTIDDVKNAYVRSWETGNKACALYRDGSKLSQPLTSALVDNSVLVENDSDMMTEPLEMAPLQKMVDQAVEQLPLAPAEARPVAEALVHNYVAVRRALPDERNSHTLKARLGGHTVYLTSSAYQDEKLGEIMITTSKEGAAWRSLLNQFAIAVSIGLQYGVPLEAFVKSFTWQKFEPSGIVQGGSNRVKMATSIVDYIFRELAIKYLGKDDLANVSAEDLEYTSISRPEETPDGLMRVAGEKRDIQMTLDFPTDVDEEMERVRISRERGFTGDICQNCGQSQMTRNGTCLKCNACGETTGCS